jgi:hypothetical protein
MVVPMLSAFSLGAQAHFMLVGSETIQSRLDLYKGNDSTRAAALLKLFAEAGCPTENLSEQPVSHRKQPDIVTTQASQRSLLQGSQEIEQVLLLLAG